MIGRELLLLGASMVLSSAGEAAMDDGRYVNRLAVDGALDLGAGWQLDPGYLGVDSPAVVLLPTPRGAFWWQTRDLDFGLEAALFPQLYLGEVDPILRHRPDALVELGLDARGAERVGVELRGRVGLDSVQRLPGERPDAFEPWAVPLWGGDLAEGLAPTQADLRPVVSLYPELAMALELGLHLELDHLRWLEPQRVLWGMAPAQRLAAGPVLGARFDLTPDLALLGRAQGGVTSWSHEGEATDGWDWQAWGGLDGRVAPALWLRLLAGATGGRLDAEGSEPLPTRLLAAAELALGREGPWQLSVGYRHGPLDLHLLADPERPFHYGYLRAGGHVRALELGLDAGYRQQVAASNDLPAAAALVRAEATVWVHDWIGLGGAGFFEQALEVEDGWPWADGRFYGGAGVLRVGRMQPPSWRRPG